MSAELIEQLNKKVLDLTAALKAERRDTRSLRELLGVRSIGEAVTRVGELVEGSKEIPTLRQKVTDLESRSSTPDEKDTRIKALESEILAGKHRSAFGSVKLAEGVTLEHLWHALQYKAEGEAPTADKVAELLKGAPAAFLAPAEGASSATTPPAGGPLTSGPGGSRGASDKSPARVTYTAEEIRQPGWEQRRPELKAAFDASLGGAPGPVKVEAR